VKMAEMEKSLTIIIPTKNRPNFLTRLLNFYFSQKIRFKIIIADSSDESDRAINETIVNHTKSELAIDYHLFPSDMEIFDKLIETLSLVESRYVLINADDDFFIPSAIESGVDFLKKNPDYSVVHGNSYVFYLKNHDYQGNFLYIATYYQRSIETNSSSDRLNSHLTDNSSTFYSIHATETLINNFSLVKQMNFDSIFSEIFLTCMDCVQGKMKCLDTVYTLRQGNTLNRYSDPFDWLAWMSDDKWETQHNNFSGLITRELAKAGNTNDNGLKKLVIKSFYSYLAPLIYQSYLVNTKSSPEKISGISLVPCKQLNFSKNLGLLIKYPELREIYFNLSPTPMKLELKGTIFSYDIYKKYLKDKWPEMMDIYFKNLIFKN